MTRVRKPLTDEQKAQRAAYMREYRKRNPETVKEHGKRYRDRNKDKNRDRKKDWRNKNKDHVKETSKEWYLLNKDHVADVAMQRRCGITLRQYEEMLYAQGNKCAICGATESYKGSTIVRFSIDHDRSCCPSLKSCGRCVRGLLCHHCNVGIGHLRDDIDLLEAAVAYLTHHRETAIQRGSVEPHQQ